MSQSDEQYFKEMEERAARLRQQVEQGFPESWKPEKPGETLVGIFVDHDTGHTPYGPKRIVVLEDTQTKERRSVWVLHEALQSQFQRARPKIGELVAVRYEGRTNSRDGKNEY